MAKASPTQAWLWHRRLYHLNLDYINLLSKKDVVIGLPKTALSKDKTVLWLKAARTMLSASKLPLFLWPEAIATACYTQNRSIIILTHGKTAYHIINRTGLIGLVPQQQKALDYDNSGPVPQLQNVSPSADTIVPSQQELDLLFGPLYDEFFTAGTSSVNNSSSPTDNSKQQDTPPTTNIQSSAEPTTPTNVNAEENNNNQA
ncbi:retrovirus-related pol polyprotein from transposon TNT 1-94 [Tanacetum coccineum]